MSNIIPVVISERSGWTSDIFSYLLSKRRIFLTGPIDMSLAESIIAQIEYLNALNNNDIEIIIQSGGGQVNAGNSIIDFMRLSKSRIICVATGSVASMASVILSCGDFRVATKRAEILIHQPHGGFFGKETDIEKHTERISEMKRELIETIAYNSKRKFQEVADLMESDHIMNSQQALEFGIVDKII